MQTATHIPFDVSYLDYKGKYKGILSWLLSTDHKRIALMYMYSMMVLFLVGVGLGLAMRLELIAPGKTIVDPQTFNALFTVHGVIMIFMIVIPGLSAVFGNFFLPLMIGAKDVAFPKVNLMSYYFYLTGAFLVISSVLFGSGTPDTGWTFYAPYSFKTGTNLLPAIFGAFVLGFSSILTGLNFIVTIHRMRAPGMKWLKMPLFPWSIYATAWIQLLATPIIGITLV
ncbi:MAG TPA: cbb3-type cytochrome c oxidase subunit I, partial [Prolixibacteraceae bacterium]|nr:cbb3-type cytochrome c oxidase subunit I [Prolixibacteraceae bacterium]